jgi:hypothetical protein
MRFHPDRGPCLDVQRSSSNSAPGSRDSRSFVVAKIFNFILLA